MAFSLAYTWEKNLCSAMLRSNISKTSACSFSAARSVELMNCRWRVVGLRGLFFTAPHTTVTWWHLSLRGRGVRGVMTKGPLRSWEQRAMSNPRTKSWDWVEAYLWEKSSSWCKPRMDGDSSLLTPVVINPILLDTVFNLYLTSVSRH